MPSPQTAVHREQQRQNTQNKASRPVNVDAEDIKHNTTVNR